jgi:hypothetical protein
VAGGEDGGDVGDPGEGGDDDFAGAAQVAQGGHGDEVGGGAGVDEDAAAHAEPLRPFLLEGADVGGLGQDGVALEEGDDGVAVRGRDVVFHQGQLEGHGTDSKGVGLEKMIWEPAWSRSKGTCRRRARAWRTAAAVGLDVEQEEAAAAGAGDLAADGAGLAGGGVHGVDLGRADAGAERALEQPALVEEAAEVGEVAAPGQDADALVHHGGHLGQFLALLGDVLELFGDDFGGVAGEAGEEEEEGILEFRHAVGGEGDGGRRRWSRRGRSGCG